MAVQTSVIFKIVPDSNFPGRVQLQRHTVTTLTGIQDSAIGPVDLGARGITSHTVDTASGRTSKEAYKKLDSMTRYWCLTHADHRAVYNRCGRFPVRAF